MSLKNRDHGYPVVPFDLLGIQARGVLVPDGPGAGVKHVVKTDFVDAINHHCPESPFSPYVRRKMESITANLMVRDKDGPRLTPCLSQRAAMEVALMFPNEIGDRVRQLVLDAFEQLERFNASPITGAEHYAGKAVDDGADPEWVKSRIEVKLDHKVLCGDGIKPILDETGVYQKDKKFSKSCFGLCVGTVNQKATGKKTDEIRREAGVPVATDGMNLIELQLKSLGMKATTAMLRAKKAAIIATHKVRGKHAMRSAMVDATSKACDPVEMAREQYKRMGLL